MSGKNRAYNFHMIIPETKSHTADLGPNASWMPEFTTPRAFADEKIKMLEKDMYIKLTRDERFHLRSLKTEGEINAAVKTIIDRYWS